MRSTVAYLSSENLLHNLQVIKQLVNNAKIIAMVKANAYGHGLRSVSLKLQKHVDFLGVASIDEALQLRKAGIVIPIVLMEGIFEEQELLIAVENNFSIVLHNDLQVIWLINAINNKLFSEPINIWLKIDTGMGRLGFNVKDGRAIYNLLSKNVGIANPIGIMSHFACADDMSSSLNLKQINNFDHFIESLNIHKNHANNNEIINGKTITNKISRSMCNSAAIFNFPTQNFEVVRPGIALYGVSSIQSKTAHELNLKPVMTLKTKIIAVKELPRGSSIGYGSRFICPCDLRVAVIGIGYGDGYPRSAIDGTPVLIHNKRCKIVGRISMDMTVVDLTNCLEAKIGDDVILWGNNLPIEEIINYTQNSVYDVLTAVQNRVRFVWV